MFIKLYPSLEEMKTYNYKDMIRGWFVGDFEPTAFSTKNCEVAHKKYKAGDVEKRHWWYFRQSIQRL